MSGPDAPARPAGGDAPGRPIDGDAPARPADDGRGALAGTGTLVRLALRRDRVLLPVWIVAIAGYAVVNATSAAGLYPTERARAEFASGAGGNPATLAIYGPSADLHTLGGIATWKFGVAGAILLGLMSIFSVVRHTRADEQAGRLELVGAGVVGRRAPLTAAILVALGANLVVAPLVALGLMAGGVSAGAAFGYGFSLMGIGWVFTGVAAVTAQLCESSRAANSIAAATLAGAFLLRAVGDAAGSDSVRWLTWLSPNGWVYRARVFSAAPHWWVLALPVAATLLLVALGYVLVARRDLGAGLLPDRPGPASGGARLGGPVGLAWRLQRGLLIGWSVAIVVAGVVIGSLAQGIAQLTGGGTQVADILSRLGGKQGLVDAYLAACMSIVGLITAVYAVQATLRLRGEETDLRAEPLLATRVGRIRWAVSHLVFVVGGSAVLLALAGLAIGLADGLRAGDVSGQVPRVLGGMMVQLPAVLVVAAVALALFGLVPRFAALAWVAVVICLSLSLFGDLLRLNQRIIDVSPFAHVPKLPGGTVTAAPLLVLLLVAAVIGTAGLVGLRRRDIG